MSARVVKIDDKGGRKKDTSILPKTSHSKPHSINDVILGSLMPKILILLYVRP